MGISWATAAIKVKTVGTVDRCYIFLHTMRLPKLPRCALDSARTSFRPQQEKKEE
jgi:hypothetical protein